MSAAEEMVDVLDPPAAAPSRPAPDSPLARVRAQYAAQQRDRYEDIDVWADGSLVARVRVIDDTRAVGGTMRAIQALTASAGDGETASVDDMADLIAAATTQLYSRGEDGELEPVLSAGEPLAFDSAFGAAIGVPEVTTPAGAVIVALTEGEPPRVNAMRLASVAMEIATWLATGKSIAEHAASGPSALSS